MSTTNGAARATPGACERIRTAIETTLTSRRAPPDTRMGRFEDRAKTLGKRAWGLVQRHPYIAVAATGTLGALAASTIGPGELAVGAVVAFTTYNVLKGRQPPEKAIEQLVRELAGVRETR